MYGFSWPMFALAMVLGALVTIVVGRVRWKNRRKAIDRLSGYAEGVQMLFHDQPDKAVTVFMKMLEQDPDTIEPHFALATLFRKKGEVDRAIRIHQNLIARQGIEPMYQTRALEELARDFLNAGLLDRAETITHTLLEHDAENRSGLEILLKVFETEHEWDKAVGIAVRLQNLGVIGPENLAQYYCEQADYLFHGGDESASRKAVKQALRYDKDCARAFLILGNIELSLERFKAAIRQYQRVAWKSPEFLSEVVKPLIQCYEQSAAPKKDLDTLAKRILEQDAVRPALLMAETMIEQGDLERAAAFLETHIDRYPSLSGLQLLIKIRPIQAHADSEKTLVHTLEQLTKGLRPYRCDHCGFSSGQLHWQCPSCHVWGVTHAL